MRFRQRRVLFAVAIVFLVIALLLLIFPGQKLSNVAPVAPPRHSKLLKVSTRLGTTQEGNVWLGASVPFGMIKSSIDCRYVQQGFHPTDPITGISLLHVSGTGGGESYKVIQIHPVPDGLAGLIQMQKTWPRLPDLSRFSINSGRSNEVTYPGFYGVTLTQVGVRVEMVSTRLAAKHRYIIDTTKTPEQVTIVFDLGFSPGQENAFRGGQARIVKGKNSKDLYFKGYAHYREYWAGGASEAGSATDDHAVYTIYYCAKFEKYQQPIFYGVIDSDGVREYGNIASSEKRPILASFAIFNTKGFRNGDLVAELSVGLSFSSLDNACTNLENESAGKNFMFLLHNAYNSWNTVVDKITVSQPVGGPEMEVAFYSSLYRTFLMPTNASGDPPQKWNGTETQDVWNDFYTFWDTMRTLHPLLTLIAPDVQSSIVRGIIEIAKKEGFLFDSRVAHINGLTQVGVGAEVVLADAFVKNLGGIDFQQLLEVLLKNVNVPSANFVYEGRGNATEEWQKLGYIPFDTYYPDKHLHLRAAARTVENSYNDFVISQVARKMGAEFKSMHSNWKNLWNANTTSFNISGFIIPKDPDGNFLSDRWANPTLCSGINYNGYICHLSFDAFYEDSSWAYSLYVPHQMESLISFSGGVNKFQKRLDTFFKEDLYNPGNEPAFLTPYLYNYICRPDLTAERVRNIISTRYSHKTSGIPGNDDSGAMASWYIFSTLGFFPVAGQDLYLIGAPHFSNVEMVIGVRKKLLVISHNLDSNHLYIDKIVLNGAVLDRAFFTHAELIGDSVLSTLEFWMTELPSSSWCKSTPPSY